MKTTASRQKRNIPWCAMILLTGLLGYCSGVHATPCAPHTVPSAIQHRWDLSGGATGPLGCPTAEPLTLTSGTLQQFEHGQVAFSPNQGTAMTVAIYQTG